MLSNNISNYNSYPRKGCKDLWNARYLKGASYTEGNDIPICPKCTGTIPTGLIEYSDAKNLHKKLVKEDPNYHIDKYVHFYQDDQSFEGKRTCIWEHVDELIDLLRHFAGAISPDFSTYADFPHFIKGYNIYRMRAFDYIFQDHDIPVIHNTRWGTSETWSYCFDGIPQNGIIAIGVIASGLDKVVNRKYFKDGFMKAIELLAPATIIIYGSDNFDLFDEIRARGINIVAFPSKTNLAHKKEGKA